MLQAFGMIVAAGLMTYLFLKIPFVVSSHLAGLSTLSPGGALQTAAGFVGMATGLSQLAWPRGGSWAIRQPRAIQGPPPRALLPAPVRSGPPPMPTASALNATLRSGAQFLGHDHGAGGPHVSL
jgi:hypothetical protein